MLPCIPAMWPNTSTHIQMNAEGGAYQGGQDKVHLCTQALIG